MKFLCVSCDEPMKMIESPAPDRGSLSIVYGCPKCDHRMAMLTNPYETPVPPLRHPQRSLRVPS